MAVNKVRVCACVDIVPKIRRHPQTTGKVSKRKKPTLLLHYGARDDDERGWGWGAGKSESCVALHRETRSDAVIGRQAAHHLTALALADGVQLGESLPRELQVVVHEVVLVERRLVDHTSAQHLHSPPRQSCDGSDLVLCTVDCGLRATRVFTCFSIVRCN